MAEAVITDAQAKVLIALLKRDLNYDELIEATGLSAPMARKSIGQLLPWKPRIIDSRADTEAEYATKYGNRYMLLRDNIVWRPSMAYVLTLAHRDAYRSVPLRKVFETWAKEAGELPNSVEEIAQELERMGYFTIREGSLFSTKIDIKPRLYAELRYIELLAAKFSPKKEI